MRFFKHNDYMPSSEGMISMQKNDWIVDELVNIVEEGAKIIEQGAGIDDGRFRKLYERIEKSLEKRFGMPVRLMPATGAMYAMEIPGPMTETGLYTLKDLLEDKTNPLIILLNLTGLIKSDPFYKKVMEFNKWLDSNVVEVDLEKAYIKNFPSNNYITLYWDFYATIKYGYLGIKDSVLDNLSEYFIGKFNSIKVTPRHVIAPVLHEIGHAFGAISFLYQTRKNRVVFEDVVRDQIRKGSTPKKAIQIAYENAYRSNSKNKNNSDNSGVTRIYLNIFRKEFGKWSFSNMQASTDGEFTSDQFANRFGVGKELAEFLDDFHKRRSFVALSGIIASQFLLLIIMTIAAPGAAFGMILSMLVFCLFYTLCGIVYQIFPNAFPWLFGKRTYDADVRRIERIKLDVVRQLRITPGLTEEDKKKLIDTADVVSGLARSYTSWLSVNSSRWGNYIKLPIWDFITGAGNIKELDEFEKSLEEVMENDLYLEAARLETLGK